MIDLLFPLLPFVLLCLVVVKVLLTRLGDLENETGQAKTRVENRSNPLFVDALKELDELDRTMGLDVPERRVEGILGGIQAPKVIKTTAGASEKVKVLARRALEMQEATVPQHLTQVDVDMLLKAANDDLEKAKSKVVVKPAVGIHNMTQADKDAVRSMAEQYRLRHPPYYRSGGYMPGGRRIALPDDSPEFRRLVREMFYGPEPLSGVIHVDRPLGDDEVELIARNWQGQSWKIGTETGMK